MKQSVIKNRNGLDPEKFGKITEAIGFEESMALLEANFHPGGLRCHACGSSRRVGGGKTTKGMPRYRCTECKTTYTVLSGTIFSGSKMGAKEIVVFMFLLSIGADAAAISSQVGIAIPAVRMVRNKVEFYRL